MKNIVTISRQNGTNGNEVADKLARRLKVPLLDKGRLEQMKGRFGIPDFPLERLDEKKPNFWEQFDDSKKHYLHFLRAALLSTAKESGGVILGRGGASILSKIPGALHVRIISSTDRRLERICAETGCSKHQAQAIINHSDHDRNGFNRFYFGHSAHDRNNPRFDMILNCDAFDADQIIKIILKALPPDVILEKTGESIDTALLCEELFIAIRYKHEIPVDLLDIQPVGGCIEINGIAAAGSVLETVMEIAEKTSAGRRSLKCNLGIVAPRTPPFSML